MHRASPAVPGLRAASLLAVLLATACTGDVSDRDTLPPGAPPFDPAAPIGALPPATAGAAGGAAAPPSAAACAAGAVDTSAGALRRLSELEYQLSLQDLFQLTAPPSTEGIPADTDKDGFKTFAALQTVSAQHLSAYLEVAGRLATELLADTQRRSRVIGCRVETADCLPAFIGRFGKQAFRRPLEMTEVSAIAKAAMDNALDVNDRYRYAIEALLSSPSFVYRVELGDKPDGVAKLTPQELASRLSFALWGRAPTAELMEQATAGALETPQGLAQVANQLAADPRAQQFLESFFRQWLGFELLRAPKVPAADWNDAFLVDMQRETSRVLADFAWGNRNFLDVLTVNSTRVTPALAKFYGLPAPAADGLVTIPANHPRENTGILTHASLLGAKSDGDRIAIRGNWLRRTFLCRNLQVPPEVAEQFGELLVGLTRVEIVKKRNMEAGCKGCHAAIDPIGIGFEQFDESGRFDPKIDVAKYGLTAALPDAPDPEFASIAELSSMLRELPEVSECLTERLFLYTNGREPDVADGCTVASAAATFDATNHDFRALLRGLVEAPAFRVRRAPTALP